MARSGTWKTCSHSENVEKFVVAKDENLGANLELVFQYDGNVDFEESVLAPTGIWKTCSHSENVEKLFVAKDEHLCANLEVVFQYTGV